ncbi:MAG: phospho-sugar mutase [Clostridia bacterium]|nr:phospho-sugar mutase [Clostridia bacterium]
MTDFQSEYKKWCQSPIFDEQTRREVCALTDEGEIEDRFYRSLSFGTGGLRGLIGAGTNRMNIYTVGKATQGLANYIHQQTKMSGQTPSAVIAYDSRNMSYEFALCAALVLCANGIKAYLFEGLRPTPELSFAVRHLRCTAGIMVTASHNPPAYNGYKVYWQDGGQIVAPHDREIIAAVNAVNGFENVKRMEESEAIEQGLLRFIGKQVDDQYIAAVKNTLLNAPLLKTAAQELKIVYTPLHGTGNIPVRRVLKELGFTKVWVVPEQELPDGNFSTVEYPNPEDGKAFALALKLARKKDADVVLATDPDADRLGIYAKDAQTGEYLAFTGNMSGLLIADYRLSQLQERGELPQNPADGALVTTVVSSNMAFEVAKAYGLSVIEVLTGFKFIGEQIKRFEDAKNANGGKLNKDKYAYEYLFGFEESYGCLVGTHARDKDAIAAVASLCEAAAYYKSKGLTLCDKMREMYEKYGHYLERQESITLQGVAGVEKIREIMEDFKTNPPQALADAAVLALRDYQTGVRKECGTGEQTLLTLPKSDVFYLELEGDGWCCIRPSGTEPKIKFYWGVRGQTAEDAEQKAEALQHALLRRVYGEEA